MRITFLSPVPNLSGGIRAIAAHADGLARLGHDVTIVAVGPKPVPLRRKVKSVILGRGWPDPGGVRPSHFDAGSAARIVRLSHGGPIVAREVPDADVVIASWWETAEWMHALPPAKGTKVYFVQHDETIFDGQPAARVDATYRWPMAKICVARWLADLMASRYGEADVPVVPCGIDHGTFAAPPRGKQARPTVGFMYSSTRFKATEVAVAAIERARAEVPDLRVVAFGEKTTGVTLPRYVEYEVRPPQARIAEIYASADAWLFSSRCEGFGLPILEAMACRTPVIGTAAGIAADVLPDGGGRLIAVGDVEAMAAAIVSYCRMPGSKWHDLSDRAVATASGFRWDAATRLFEANLTRLTAAGGGFAGGSGPNGR